ncbi:MAG: SDR family oxidoreductase [Flavobacteriaceae bacterium]|nr:SDR family oxidoreductase [Flavobacteriaceae bacterium]MCI5088661.1 SDR family oxidoreductase [Flavobacteriaceae bacterium]CAI8213816.1 MAG: 3-oxoacyl-[acyl-carrier-protein] reductase FabG [SAR116 cluster bacterium]
MAHIVITGTSRGIGYEMAQILAGQGHEVLALSRSATAVAALENKHIHSFDFDITQPADIAQAVAFVRSEWAGHVDALINNAGALVNSPFLETSIADFKQVYEVNVFGVAALTQALIPFMPNGHVVTVSSMGGVQGSSKFPGLSAYSSSKGAVITLTELWAEEFKEKGPAFNVLAIGAVKTEMLAAAFPGYEPPTTAAQMGRYIADFALNGHELYNGKILPVSNTTP